MLLNFYSHFKDQQTQWVELNAIVDRVLHDELLASQTALYRANRQKELKMMTPLFAFIMSPTNSRVT